MELIARSNYGKQFFPCELSNELEKQNLGEGNMKAKANAARYLVGHFLEDNTSILFYSASNCLKISMTSVTVS